MPVIRDEEIRGLHPKPCRRQRHANPMARVTTQRRWAFALAGLPLVSLYARWTHCTGCRRTSAWPRIGVSTVLTLLLVTAFLMGLGVVPLTSLIAWTTVLGFAAVWLLGQAYDEWRDRKLVPIPHAAYHDHSDDVTASRGARLRAEQGRLGRGSLMSRVLRKVPVWQTARAAGFVAKLALRRRKQKKAA